MVTNDRISRLAQQLGERLQGASHAPEELQRNVQQVVKGAFDRMELVTREDFDILMDVLQRTRSRVESLEKQVAALEAAIDQDAPASVETPLAAEAADVAPQALDESPADEETSSVDQAAEPSADKKAPGQH
ncbi:accessory factor UbiK family protein [Onishia niordana]|uniref:accessory factor UbiK family protein n=1 Tax=Onishia niordana TaxID=2508711 RepID=UPI0010A009D7|nr:accessory factor UbiK family protein [Halomonas niordiana]